MTEEERLDRRYELQYVAEYSTRYHRRRATFLTNTDTIITLLTIAAGASAFTDLVSGSPGWLAKLGSATVTLLSLAQVILKLGPQGTAHGQWLRQWNSLLTDIVISTNPDDEKILNWLTVKAKIEEECIGELRALALDCEDAASRVMRIPNRQHYFSGLQRLLIHFGTFQQDFPLKPLEHIRKED
ncbi:hypothetical protein [Sphingomonas sp. 1185]|uniref:hypothetical protein n=1 Tax=Sphingomonas sp. 1185 TaxID=3156411 RepID=UPI0033984973